MPVTRANIVAEALSWVGTPFAHQQTVKGVGCDCAGLVRGVLIALGLMPADLNTWPESARFLGYGREPDGRMVDGCAAYLEPVAQFLPGDVLLCSFRAGLPRHVGIVTEVGERTYWVHANDNAKHGRVHVARLVFGPHRMALVQAYRVPGLT